LLEPPTLKSRDNSRSRKRGNNAEYKNQVDEKEVPLMQSALNISELVLLILAILVGFAVLGTIALVLLRLLRTKRVAKKRPERYLEITDLDKDLADRVHEVKRSLLPEKERRKFKKKKAEKQYDSTVFVVDFHPSLRAHEVDKLREEIDIIMQVATPKDEVVVRID
jgi:serine protease SohB